MHHLVGQHELDERGVGEDRVPRPGDPGPAAQRRPAGVRDRAAVGALPDLGHQIEVTRLERGVVRRVRGRDGSFALGHGCHDGAPCLLAAPISHRFLAPSGLSLAVHDWGGDGRSRCCSRTPPASTGARGRRSPPSSSPPAGRSGRSTSAATATATRRPTVSTAGRSSRSDALAVTHHLGLAGDPELLAVGHSKGGASLLWGAVHEPGTYPRIWTFEPIIVPFESPILARTDNPLSAGARRRRDQWPSRAEAIASYGSKPPLNALLTRRARGVRRLRDAGPSRRHRRAQVPPGGRGDDVHDGREPRLVPRARPGHGAGARRVRRDDHLHHPGVRGDDRRSSSRTPRSRSGATAATSVRSRTRRRPSSRCCGSPTST